MRVECRWFCVVVWFVHLVLGIGAGYAAIRLWYLRHHPLMGKVGIYINGFIVEVVTATVLLFLALEVHLTWKFAAVWFTGALLADVLRVPLILYLIRGPKDILPPEPKSSREMRAHYWPAEFREIRQELKDVTNILKGIKPPNDNPQ